MKPSHNFSFTTEQKEILRQKKRPALKIENNENNSSPPEKGPS